VTTLDAPLTTVALDAPVRTMDLVSWYALRVGAWPPPQPDFFAVLAMCLTHAQAHAWLRGIGCAILLIGKQTAAKVRASGSRCGLQRWKRSSRRDCWVFDVLDHRVEFLVNLDGAGGGIVESRNLVQSTVKVIKINLAFRFWS
jgi:hypothetical protein